MAWSHDKKGHVTYTCLIEPGQLIKQRPAVFIVELAKLFYEASVSFHTGVQLLEVLLICIQISR